MNRIQTDPGIGTAIVIPSYNEATLIGGVVRDLKQALPEAVVIVVDDGSTDGTWGVLQDLPVHRLCHPVNLGQGAALQTGITYAVEQGAEFIVTYDADGQHRPEDITRLLEP